MDVHTGNIRENYKKAADDKSYLDLFGGGVLCVQLWALWLSGTSLFIIVSCVLPLFMIYKVMNRGVAAWPRKTCFLSRLEKYSFIYQDLTHFR